MDEQTSILIADDDAGLTETLSDILKEKGYKVVTVEDGEKAITEVKNQHFNLALIDIMMPGMNGVEALREIKKANPKITTMIMTGHSALEGMVSEAIDAGVDGVLYKPFEIETIVEMIENKTEAHVASPLIDLKKYQIQPEALRVIPEEVARKYDVIPLRIEGDTLIVAMSHPEDFNIIEDLRVRTKMQIKPLRAALMDVRGAINLHYRAAAKIEREIEHITATDFARFPAVRIVDLLIAGAVKEGASDIHIEPQQDRLRIRYRVDGYLREALSLPLSVYNPLLARLKVLAKMDIAERRRPQEGRFTIVTENQEVDVRATTVNTAQGEVAVLHLLDKALSIMNLSELGFLPDVLTVYKKLIESPSGMIVVGGPTGSGKTTTLYATINHLNTAERNIVTIEDPVEYQFADIKQIQVNPQLDITFAGGLRTIMRLDPDVILVGEIRDVETARIAIQAALTGHLVLTSVHANDTVGVLFRLIDLGMEPFLITSAVIGLVAQHLVRRVCPHCRSLHEVSPEERLAYEGEVWEARNQFYYGEGCNYCGYTGYLGRTGVFELMVMSYELKRLLMQGASADDILAQAVKEGMVPLQRAGMLKVQKGITTPQEVLRQVFFGLKSPLY